MFNVSRLIFFLDNNQVIWRANLCNAHILNLYVKKKKIVIEIIWELQGLGFLHFSSNGALVLS